MINPQKDWILFDVEKLTEIGSIALPDNQSMEKEEVRVVRTGPEVENIKMGDYIIVAPRDVVKYTPHAITGNFRGFVQEKDIIAVVVSEKDKITV